MSKRHKQAKKESKTVRSGGAGDRAAEPARGERRKVGKGRGRGTAAPRRFAWVRGKRAVFQFVGVFILLMALFYACTFIPVMEKKVLPGYMRLNARASATILSALGEPKAAARGTAVSSERNTVDIRHGCDAIEPSALFIAAVLAFPASFWSKLPGLLAGTVVLAIINLTRIVTLFYVGIHFPRAFEIMHVDIWQPVFILLSLVLWVIWALWATRGKVLQADGAT